MASPSERGSFLPSFTAGNSDPDFALAGGRFIWLISGLRVVKGTPDNSPMRVIRTAFAGYSVGRNVTEIAAREVV